MRHLDPDILGIAALDEPLDRWSTEHLLECGACGEEVSELQGVVMLARSGGYQGRIEAPDPSVWTAVAGELGLSESTAVRDADAQGAVVMPIRRSDGDRADQGRADPGRTGGSATTGRRVPAWWLAAAAVVGIAAGGGAMWGFQSANEGSGSVLARAELTPLPDYPGSGRATLSGSDDGARSLDVALTGPSPSGYREVWLLAPDAGRMYSLGLMDGDEGTFAVPSGIDLEQFPVVDVSDEPPDGDPTHSGVSMVRGRLDVPGA